jgi:fluoroacetyl-CoA thioesterase
LTEQLQVGRSYQIELLVTPELTADRFGNTGVEVFATPALIALLEAAAIQCVAPTLTAERGTVGTRVDVQHLAATPVGLKVTARAELVEIDGRRLVFNVEAHDERELIAKGIHERFIVNSMPKFLARAMEKTK